MAHTGAATVRYPHVKRVLIYKLGSLGDFVITLPCFHLVERAFPNASRMLLTNVPMHAKSPAASALLSDSGLIHQYLEYPLQTRRLFDFAKLWMGIRRFSPQVLVYLTERSHTAKRDRMFFRMCGVKHIIGTPAGDLMVLRYDPALDLYEREAERLARCIGELGDAHLHERENWDLRLTMGEKEKARTVLSTLLPGNLICCGIGTKQQAKDWGNANWYAFLSRLAERFPNHGLVLVGSKEERDASDVVSVAWPGPRINLCGDLTPRETVSVMTHAELFVGPDSGPMHLAAAAGIPSASVFSAQSKPGVWFPFGAANLVVYHKTDCFDCGLSVCVKQGKKCILSITPDEMLGTAMEAWRRGQEQKWLGSSKESFGTRES